MDTRTPHTPGQPAQSDLTWLHSIGWAAYLRSPRVGADGIPDLATAEQLAVAAVVEAVAAALTYCAACVRVLGQPWGGLQVTWVDDSGGERYEYVRNVAQAERIRAGGVEVREIRGPDGGLRGLYASTIVAGEPRCGICAAY